MTSPHIPVLRQGKEYSSLDQKEVTGIRDGKCLAQVSQANAGIIKRDLRKIREKAKTLRELPTARLLEICKEAGKHFLEGTLPMGDGLEHSPRDYIETLSETSGLPHTLCQRNMQKVFTVFDQMPDILKGLTRGMDPSVIDSGFGEHAGVPVCYSRSCDALGVVLPSNSPGVNSIWMPAIALKTPVVLKPGKDEPWTPMRIVQAFLAAGCPPEAFSFYPTDHEGAATILQGCGRALLFGDAGTTKKYANNPSINLHGPGRSKVLVGEDIIENWRDHLDILVRSVADNGGRSCINASSILVPSHADEIADAIAQELIKIKPLPAEDSNAKLSAFANPKFAEYIDQSIEQGLKTPGARDLTQQHRSAERRCELDGAQYLHPTVIHCDSIDHPLAKSEYMFPFVAVVEVPHAQMVAEIGPSLVVSGITKDPAMIDDLVNSKDVDRLNLGPVPTSHVEWDQPHEGNLFEFLYKRRAIERKTDW